MNKIYIRNILLTILLILFLILIFTLRDRSPFGKGESSFASNPEKGITRIELTGGNEKIVLSLEENVWKVNGKKEARKSAVLYIGRVLTEMKIKSPVSQELFDNEIVSKKIQPVRVKVFEKRRLLKSFYVYKTGSNRYGNIMKRKEKTKPFIVHIPGYEADIGSVFVTAELFWLPYTVFNMLPSEISSVSFRNFTDPASSFTINATGSNYELADMENILERWDTSRVKRYISYFTWVPFESWVFDINESERRRLSSANPVFRISVRKKDGSEVNLSLWDRYVEEKKDTDRLWGKMGDNEEYFIMRYFDIDPLLKKIDYFFPE